MKNFMYKYLMFAMSIVLSSCSKDIRESLDLSGDVSIHSFEINGVNGSINSENSTISVVLPAGTDLKQLSPQIVVGEGAEVSPASGELVNFADDNGNLRTITYTVINKDLYQKYYVTADVARAKITSFKIGGVEGDIDETNKKIILYLPNGIDLKSLTPIIEYTEGSTITPDSGVELDFTNPVNYTLNYLGSTFTYEVTIYSGEAPKPILTLYNGENVLLTWASIASTINNGYANPKTDGINTTSSCVSIMRNKEESDDGGRPWSGGALWNANKVNIDPAEYTKFTLMVLKNSPGDVQLEIQSDGEQNKDWLKAPYSADALGEWQELTFEIPEGRTAIINNVLVAPHVIETANDPDFTSQLIYWDELKAYPKD